jgi:NADH:ubiquinone oxidoreductase subunit E
MPRHERRQRLALVLSVASGLTVLGCVVWLIGDFAVATARAPEDLERVEAFEAQVKTDAETATKLHEERERQTGNSIVRRDRSRGIAWVLLFAGATFVAGGKWYTSSRPQRLPALDALVADRFAAPAPLGDKKRSRDGTVSVAESEGIDLSIVEDLVVRFGTSREAAIPILQAIQNHYRYLPDEALRRVCELTEITAAQLAGTSSFYAQFRRSPVGRHVVRVCHGTACHVAGAEPITQELRRHLEISPGEDTDSRRRFTLDAVACLGCCSLAPVMMIEEETAGRLTPATARQTLDALEPPT